MLLFTMIRCLLELLFNSYSNYFYQEKPEFTLEKMGFDSTRKKIENSCMPLCVLQTRDKLMSYNSIIHILLALEVCKNINW